MKFRISTLLIILGGLILAGGASAQNTENIKPMKIQPTSVFYVDGTSTLHKWSCTDKGASGTINVSTDLLQEPKMGIEFNTGSIVIPVDQLDSGERGMNRKIYGALKLKKYPTINYQLTSARVASVSDTAFTLQTTGKLTIAGTTKTVDIMASGKKQADGSLLFTGKKELKMTDFKVKPPTAMLGAIRSGDDITIRYHLVLN